MELSHTQRPSQKLSQLIMRLVPLPFLKWKEKNLSFLTLWVFWRLINFKSTRWNGLQPKVNVFFFSQSCFSCVFIFIFVLGGEKHSKNTYIPIFLTKIGYWRQTKL